MTHGLNPGFQVSLDVADQPCLIIGGRREAENKADRLLKAGARLTLVSPDLTPTLQAQADAGRFTHLRRRFQAEDLDGMFLVINTITGDPDLVRQIFDLARRQRILINSYDSAAFSNFGMVALVDPGHLRLSISTSNASPALAGRLRQDLEMLFDEEFVDFLDQLAQVRHRVREQAPEFPQRAALLRSLVRDFHLESRLRYPQNWRARMQTLLTCDLANCGGPARCSDCPLPAAPDEGQESGS